ncbi:LuxR C-terminal-related transcriptional regulator [Azospirillum doebereinerae]
MGSTSLVIIDANNLFRQGMVSLLSEKSFEIFGSYSSLSGAVAAGSGDSPPQLVLADPTGMGDFVETVRTLKAAYPEARLVFINETLDVRALTSTIEAGVDGFLMKDISRDVLVQSLRLVMMGEKVFPSQLAALLISGNFYGKDSASPSSQRGLSNREGQIMRCLLGGNSNKLIAKNLGITEATVKVHLKGLLRKVSATNRTQAAIWGLNNGFSEGGDGNSLAGVERRS